VFDVVYVGGEGAAELLQRVLKEKADEYLERGQVGDISHLPLWARKELLQVCVCLWQCHCLDKASPLIGLVGIT
jgi:hypothetical protein